MPELLCRRDRDGDEVNDGYAVREGLAFLIRTDSWVASIQQRRIPRVS